MTMCAKIKDEAKNLQVVGGKHWSISLVLCFCFYIPATPARAFVISVCLTTLLHNLKYFKAGNDLWD